MFITFTIPSGYTSTDAGPFNISGLTDTFDVVLLATGITKTQLLTGYTVDTTPHTIVSGTVASVGLCTNEVNYVITFTTPTPTVTPTGTGTPTATPTVTPTGTGTPTDTSTTTSTTTPTSTNTPTVVTPTETPTSTPTSTLTTPDVEINLTYAGTVCGVFEDWSTLTVNDIKCYFTKAFDPLVSVQGGSFFYYSTSGFNIGTQLYNSVGTPEMVTGNYVYGPSTFPGGADIFSPPLFVVSVLNGVITAITNFDDIPVCDEFICPTPTPTSTSTSTPTITPTATTTSTPPSTYIATLASCSNPTSVTNQMVLPIEYRTVTNGAFSTWYSYTVVDTLGDCWNVAGEVEGDLYPELTWNGTNTLNLINYFGVSQFSGCTECNLTPTSTPTVTPTTTPTSTSTPTATPTSTGTSTSTSSIQFLEGSVCYGNKMSIHPSSSTVCTNIQGGVGFVNYYMSNCDYQTVFVNGNPSGCQVYINDGVTLYGSGFLSDGCRYWEIVDGIVVSTSAQTCFGASECCATDVPLEEPLN